MGSESEEHTPEVAAERDARSVGPDRAPSTRGRSSDSLGRAGHRAVAGAAPPPSGHLADLITSAPVGRIRRMHRGPADQIRQSEPRIIRRAVAPGLAPGTPVNDGAMNGTIVEEWEYEGATVGYVIQPQAQQRREEHRNRDDLDPGWLNAQAFDELPEDVIDAPKWIDDNEEALFRGREPGDLGHPDVRTMRKLVLRRTLRMNPRTKNLSGVLDKGIAGGQWDGNMVCDMVNDGSKWNYRHHTSGKRTNHFASVNGQKINDGAWKQFFDPAQVVGFPPRFRGTAASFRALGLDQTDTDSYLGMFGL